MKGWIGTLLYYAVAFFANALFLPLVYWLYMRSQQEPSEAGDSYYSIVTLLPALLSVLPLTLGAWLLRRLARWFAWTRWWQWLLAGALTGFVALWGFGKLGLVIERAYFSLAWQPVKSALMFGLLLGPMMFSFQPWWLPLPAILATTGVLFLVQRACGPNPASNRAGKQGG